MKKFIVIIAFFYSFYVVGQNENRPFYAEVIGKGTPIVLIPGFTVSGEVWHPLVTELQKKHECHIITLAGFDGKNPIDFPWLPTINESLKKYFLKNNLQNATVIGHSLGGTIAIWLASQSDLQLSQIILVDALPATGALMFPNYNLENLAYDSPYNNQQMAMDDASFEKMAVAMSKGMSTNIAGQEKIKKWIVNCDRKTYVYGYTDYLKLDLREALKKITIPVTILAATIPYGEEMATQTYKNQYKNLINYQFIVAKESAHFIMFDKPEWFISQIQLLVSKKE